MTGDRDRNDPPGLTLRPEQVVPTQIIEHHVESCAIHSMSQGWLPAVRIEIVTEDGAGVVGLMLVEDVLAFVEILLTAAERAPLDIKAARHHGVIDQ